MKLIVRFAAWWSNVKSRMQSEQDQDRMRSFFFGLPVFLLMSVITSIIGAAIWAIVSLNTTGQLSYNELVLAMAVFTEVSFALLFKSRFPHPSHADGKWHWAWSYFVPFMARTIDANNGVGLAVEPERVHAKSRKGFWFKSLGIGLGLGALIFGLSQGIFWLVNLIPHAESASDSLMNQTTKLLSDASKDLFAGHSQYPILAVLIVLIVTVIGPFCEECLFRGVIGKSIVLSPFGKGLGESPSVLRQVMISLASGFIFGIAHAQFTGSIVPDLASVLIPGVLGAVFTWVSCYKYNSVWPTIFGHATYNTISLVAAVLI